jgi:STAS domain
MPGQQACAPPVVTLPAQLDAAAAEQAAGQITAAFTPGVSVVIADLTAAASCDRSAIRNLLKAHRKAAARGGQVRFAIHPDGPLHLWGSITRSRPGGWPGWRSSLSDLLGHLPGCALRARLPDGAGPT